MVKDPKKRLGSKNDSEEIKKHPWFSNIDWQKIALKQVKK